MGFEKQLLVGVAQLLQAEGVGFYNISAGPTAGQTGIAIGGYQPETWNRLIALDTYQVSDDLGPTTDDVIGIQVITRWEGPDPNAVKDLDGLVFDRLHGRTMFTLPTGILVSDCYRRSGAPLGQDSSKRWSRSSNFYVTVSRPTTHRP